VSAILQCCSLNLQVIHVVGARMSLDASLKALALSGVATDAQMSLWFGMLCGHADLPVRQPVNGRDGLALAVLQVSEGLIL